MQSLLFVHGINVRGPELDATMAVIREHLDSHLGSDYELSACAWGDDLGASLGLGGASIPGYDAARGVVALPEMETLALWAALYEDPFWELRNCRPASADEPLAPGEVANRRRIVEALRVAAMDRRVLSVLPAEVRADAGRVAEDLAGSEELQQCIVAAPLEQLPPMIARCFTALMLAQIDARGMPQIQGDDRDGMVANITELLGGQPKGIVSFLTAPLASLGARLATRYARRHRGSLTNGIDPILGDIIVYQGRGERIRERIANAILERGPGVVVIAHSLGGVAVVDTLLTTPAIRGQVKRLITAGSQAGFFYEIDGLIGLARGNALPKDFPPWDNFYDPSDFLSYLVGTVFPGRATDHEVPSRQPFPRSHSAYWTSNDMWTGITDALA